MDIRFTGAVGFWPTLALGLALGAAAWWLYRREVRRSSGPLVQLLPVLRAIVVLLVVLMLVKPVLHLRQVIGQVSRVLIFVDGSQSMSITDPQMQPARKLLELDRGGALPAGSLDTHLADASDKLEQIVQLANQTLGDSAATAAFTDPRSAVQRITELLNGALTDVQNTRLPQFHTSVLMAGQLYVEQWIGINGDRIADLANSHRLDTPPNAVSNISQFNFTPQGDNTAYRITGYMVPPVTGGYVFSILSDDGSELWLSDNDQPTGKQRIAYCEMYTPDWNVNPSQRSKTIELAAGKRYYVEALLKQGGGNTLLSVAWQRPDGKEDKPIPGRYLVGYQPSQDSQKLLDTVTVMLRDDLLKNAIAAAQQKDDERQTKTRAALAQLAAQAAECQTQVRTLFNAYASHLQSTDPRIKPAVDHFNGLSRWQRAQGFLLDGKQSLVGQLIGKHDVELWSIGVDGPHPLWSSRQSRDVPAELSAKPDGSITDLAQPIDATLKGLANQNVKTTVVLLSDGRENHGQPLRDTAKILGRRGIAVNTVAMGALDAPPDLAVVQVEHPSSVFYKDRVAGSVTLNDDMPAGKPFVLKITHEDRLLWQKDLLTTGAGRRVIDFDFSIEDVAQQMLAHRDADVSSSTMPVNLTVTAGPIEGEMLSDNNSADILIAAATRKHKALILDARPRWEYRYLRNALKRDGQWDVNSLTGLIDRNDQRWPRGDADGTFPRDRQTLFGYDLVIFGEVPHDWLSPEELQWLSDFVSQRAGGIIFIDGHHDELRQYAGTPLAELFPVQWKNVAVDKTDNPMRWQLTSAGSSLGPLTLESDPQKDNAQVWRELKAPHWVAPVSALPGSQTLAEAVFTKASVPVLVERNYGAGKVVYLGTDQTWRWRYNVADQYFDRFWQQLAGWTMERPYAAADRFVALDVGQTTYTPGQQVDVAVRIRDAQGKPITKAGAQAILTRNGVWYASVDLTGDENESGIYRGRTAKLPSGKYDVTVKVAQLSEAQMKARATFVVQAQTSVEMSDLTCNAAMLRSVASDSGGMYFPEENVTRLTEQLQAMSKAKIIESDLSVWDSWYWLIPILLLLTAEWIIRKRVGLM